MVKLPVFKLFTAVLPTHPQIVKSNCSNLELLQQLLKASQFLCYFSGKSQNYVSLSPEQKPGEIGYVSNINAKPKRVRAVTANIPVATESLQKFHAVQQGNNDEIGQVSEEQIKMVLYDN